MVVIPRGQGNQRWESYIQIQKNFADPCREIALLLNTQFTRHFIPHRKRNEILTKVTKDNII